MRRFPQIVCGRSRCLPALISIFALCALLFGAARSTRAMDIVNETDRIPIDGGRGDGDKVFCPSTHPVMCGMWRLGNDNKGNAKLVVPLCCALTPEAVAAGIGFVGPRFWTDSDDHGADFYCPVGAAFSGAEWGKSEQLDHGYCQAFQGSELRERTLVARCSTGESMSCGYFCPDDAIVCGAGNAPEKNDSWNRFYCCSARPPARVTVRAYKTDDPETEIPGIQFSLTGTQSFAGSAAWEENYWDPCEGDTSGDCVGSPELWYACGASPNPQTSFTREVALEPFVFSVPQGDPINAGDLPADAASADYILDADGNECAFESCTCGLDTQDVPDRFPGYTCTLANARTGEEAPCAGGSVSGTAVGGETLEFEIRYTPTGGPICQTCDTVVAGGAQCGVFPDGCNTCIPGDPNPDNTVGCLECGACANPGEVCTAEGRCTADMVVSCRAVPGTIIAGENAQLRINTANGVEPFSCAWQSEPSSLIDGQTACAFSTAFTTPGIFAVSVAVIDGSTPQKSASASCTLTVNPRTPVEPPSEPIIPNYALCEAYKVVILYGMPIFAIMVVIGGLIMLTAVGNAQRLVRGKQALTWGIAGLAVILLGKPLFSSVVAFLGFRVLLCGQPIS